LISNNPENIVFHSDGTLTLANGSISQKRLRTEYDRLYDFLKKLINYYKEKNETFDYERFYDFMLDEAADDEHVINFAKPYQKNYSSLKNVIFSLKNIYNQLVNFYIKDSDGNMWYDNSGHVCYPSFPGYTGFLNCLTDFSKSNQIHVHSLNHDLFFERLNWTDWIQGEISDGFHELGSPYYGILNANGREYRVRLEGYTGRYDKKISLYKLHGSKDYGIYYTSKRGILLPESYLKNRYGVSFGGFLKEIRTEERSLEYEHCFINFHGDFLTGTTSKIERYSEPLLYKKLFKMFRQNLRNSKKLIIIGYGAKDAEINKMILNNFDYRNRPAFIIDPKPGEAVISLQKKLNAKLINKQLEVIKMKDLS
jgi:hypothetical protein